MNCKAKYFVPHIVKIYGVVRNYAVTSLLKEKMVEKWNASEMMSLLIFCSLSAPLSVRKSCLEYRNSFLQPVSTHPTVRRG